MNRTKGTVSIEAAIVTLVLTSFWFVLFSLLQYCYLRNVSEKVALGVAEDISKYSCILYKSGLLNLRDNARAKAISAISKENSVAGNVLAELADVGIEYIEDESFSFAASIIANEKLKEEIENINLPFEIEVESLKGSEFFSDGNEFTVSVKLKSDVLFPVLNNITEISATSSVTANAWLYGGSTRYTEDEINVWELSNYKRGIVLKHLFGGNLPDKFPEIDIFDSETGLATKIVSIDTTAATYDTEGLLERKIKYYAKNLYEWNGGKYGGTEISESQIKKKTILLIMPENVVSESKMKEIYKGIVEAASLYNIEINIKNYQRVEEENN